MKHATLEVTAPLISGYKEWNLQAPLECVFCIVCCFHESLQGSLFAFISLESAIYIQSCCETYAKLFERLEITVSWNRKGIWYLVPNLIDSDLPSSSSFRAV
jgi:hypothetical protein